MKYKKSILALTPISLLTPLIASSVIVEQNVSYTDTNDTHSYYYNSTKLNLNDWMSSVPGWKKLGDLSIPGTHDSGMFDGTGPAYFFGKAWAKTQSLNWSEQLKQGIRFFDIRVNDEMWIKHGSAFANGQSLSTFLNAMVDFLKQHPKETIIFRVKDEDISTPSSPNLDFVRKMRERFESTLSNEKYLPYMFKNTEKRLDLNPTLNELRGKIFVYNHMHHNISEDIRFGTLWNSPFNKMSAQDFYDFEENVKFEFIKEFIQSAEKQKNGNNIYMNFVSRAAGKRIWDTSSPMNKKVLNYLNTEAKDFNKLGVLIFDYPGDSLVHRVVKSNYYISDEEISRGVLGKNNTTFNINYAYDYTNKINFSSDFSQNTYVDLYIDGVLKLKKYSVPNNSKVITLPNSEKLVYGQKIKIESYKLIQGNVYYPERKYNVITSEKTVEPYPPYISTIETTKSKIINALNNIEDSSIKNKIRELVQQLYLSKLEDLYTRKIASLENINLVSTIGAESNKLLNDMSLVSSLLNEVEIFNGSLSLINNIFNEQIIEQIKQNVEIILKNINTIVQNSFDFTKSNITLEKLNNEFEFNKEFFNIFKKINSSWINIEEFFKTNNPFNWLDYSNIFTSLKNKQSEIINNFSTSLSDKNVSNLESNGFILNNKIKSELDYFKNVISAYDKDKISKLFSNQIKLIQKLFSKYANDLTLDIAVLGTKIGNLVFVKEKIDNVFVKYDELIKQSWFNNVDQELINKLKIDYSSLSELFNEGYLVENAIDSDYISNKITILNETIDSIYQKNLEFEDFKRKVMSDLRLNNGIIKYIKADYLVKLEKTKTVEEINSLISECNTLNTQKLGLLNNYNLTGFKAIELIKNELLLSVSETKLNQVLLEKAKKMEDLIIELKSLQQRWLKVLGLKQFEEIIIEPYNVDQEIKNDYEKSIKLVVNSINNLSEIVTNEELTEIINQYKNSESQFVKYDYFDKKLESTRNILNISNISKKQKKTYLASLNNISYINDLVLIENKINNSKIKVQKLNNVPIYNENSELSVKLINLKDQIIDDLEYDNFYNVVLTPLNEVIIELRNKVNSANSIKTSWNYKNADSSLKKEFESSLENSSLLVNEIDINLINNQLQMLNNSINNLNGDFRFNELLNQVLNIVNNETILNNSTRNDIIKVAKEYQDINELSYYRSEVEKFINNLNKLREIKDNSLKVLSDYNYIDADDEIKNEYNLIITEIDSILSNQNNFDDEEFNNIIDRYNKSHLKLNGNVKLILFKKEKNEYLTENNIILFVNLIEKFKTELNSDDINNLTSANSKWNEIYNKVKIISNINQTLSEFNVNYITDTFKDNFVNRINAELNVEKLDKTYNELLEVKKKFDELVYEIEYDKDFKNTQDYDKLNQKEKEKYEIVLTNSIEYLKSNFDTDNLIMYINNLRNSRIHVPNIIPIIPLKPAKPIEKTTYIYFIFKETNEENNQEIEHIIGDVIEIKSNDFENFDYKQFIPEGFELSEQVYIIKGQKNNIYLNLRITVNEPVVSEPSNPTIPVEPDKEESLNENVSGDNNVDIEIPENNETFDPVIPEIPENSENSNGNINDDNDGDVENTENNNESENNDSSTPEKPINPDNEDQKDEIEEPNNDVETPSDDSDSESSLEQPSTSEDSEENNTPETPVVSDETNKNDENINSEIPSISKNIEGNKVKILVGIIAGFASLLLISVSTFFGVKNGWFKNLLRKFKK